MEEKTTNQAEKVQNPLGTLPIMKLLGRYAVPSIISMVVMSLYNIVDQIFIGRGVGYLGNSATTVAFPLNTLMLAMALLVGNGAAALISLEMGKGNTDSVKKTVGNATMLMVSMSLILGTVSIIFLKPILVLMGATESVLPYARDYTFWIMLGAPFAMISTGISGIIRADGSPRFSMFATLAGAFLNVILDPVFIFVFKMGVAGAAIATIISQAVSMAIGLYYVLRKANYAKLERKYLKLDKKVALRICSLGSSNFVTQVAISIFNIVLNNTIGYYGALSEYGTDIPLAAVGIVMKTNAILISVILGVAIGSQPILGFNYGAGNFKRVKQTYFTEITVTTILAALGSMLFIFKPEIVISIFGDPSPQFNEFAAMFMSTYLCCITATGIQIPSASYFQAVGKPTKAMVLSMTRQILFLLPLVVILPRFFGIVGIAYAGPVADIAALIVTLCFIIYEMRNLERKVGEGTAA